MRYVILIISLTSCLLSQQQVIRETLNGNNLSTRIWNTGVFNSDIVNGIFSPALEWPKGSGKVLIYTSGINLAAYVNNELRMLSSSYRGECVPGYSQNGIFYTDSRYKFYKINRGDNYQNNPDWLNWGLMVPFGAPFYDVNNNGSYEYYADIPGVRGASQTIFICFTDGDSSKHFIGEGFGGGTKPLFAEIHLTAWCYDVPEYKDMQFFKWEIINRHFLSWHAIYCSILSYNALGFEDDNFTGCDTIRNLSYCYNGDNDDMTGYPWAYGINPPAAGISFLKCNENVKMTSSVYMLSTSSQSPSCEKEVYASSNEAYNIMKGLKKDGTPWVIPGVNPASITKYCYSGDPETGSGWTEFSGKINNCGGLLTGNFSYPNIPGKRYSVLSHGSDNLILEPGDSIRVSAVQLVARGENYLSSVTKLKQLTDKAHELCQNGFIIGINNISSKIPSKFHLYQNYPNPFNPVTKIRFDLPSEQNIKIKIYDLTGRELAVVLDSKLRAGEYEAEWNGAGFSSGVYFCKLQSESYFQIIKMILMK